MKIYMILIIHLLCISVVHSQKTDYLKMRKQAYMTSCGNISQVDIERSLDNLASLDTFNMKNLDAYYEDKATCYWLLSNQHPEYLDVVIALNQKALYHSPDHTKALYNLAFAYKRKSDCPQALEFANLYKDRTQSKYWLQDTQLE
ncbi:MAG: hypothetical protein M3R25_12570 [Bacteroidota bacterium]|nr:hypothetical protein [Bacteroidota bacterium]